MLITVTLNPKGTFRHSNLYHNLFLCTISKDFLKSTMKQMKLLWLFQHSFVIIILRVIKLSIFKWWLLKLVWPLDIFPQLSNHIIILFFRMSIYPIWEEVLLKFWGFLKNYCQFWNLLICSNLFYGMDMDNFLIQK